MGLLDKIKNDVKKSGTNKGKFLYFKEGTKVRIRFLNDMEEGLEVKFHDSFALSVNVPCQETFGRSCEYCDNEDLRTRSQYVWSVWDYESNEVKLFMAAVNNCSPVPSLVAMYDTYGTLMDRDYVVTKTGKQQNTSFSVVPMDKVKFRNDKAKPFASKKLLDLLDKAFPNEAGSEDDDEKPAPKPTKSGKNVRKDVDGDNDYKSMTAKQLYDLCVDRGIDALKRKDAAYYIERIQDAEVDDDAWEDDEEPEDGATDYSDLTAKELYALCKERKLECQPKKPEKYYINLLEESDKAEEDWGDESGEDDGWDE